MSTKAKKSKPKTQPRKHKVVSRKAWLTARIKLLKEEKALTRRSDKVAKQRQQLPWVQIDKDYSFDTDDGEVSLADFFKGRSQLLIYHFMFGPDYTQGCTACSTIADGFNGFSTHLANHGVMLWAVSRAPIVKLQDYKKRMGWTFPWASSFNSDFNFDFNIQVTEQQQREGGAEYNYRREPASIANRALEGQRTGKWRNESESGGEGPVADMAARCGTDAATYIRERPGMSAFVLEDGIVYHTYSAYARGLDGLWGMYQWLDRAPKGRNETSIWFRRHDEYGSAAQNSGSCCG